MTDPLRGTGRTTRMLEEAKRLADEGRRVYVIMASWRHHSLVDDAIKYHPGIKLETWECRRVSGPVCFSI